MVLKNTLKNVLIASIFVSSIAISTNAEAARKSQMSTEAKIGICLVAGLATLALINTIAICWIGAKCYFAKKLGGDRLKLLKKFNHSIPELELQQAGINPNYEMPYDELKTEAQTVYNNHTLSPSTQSLKYKLPVAALYTNVKEIGFCRKISRLFIPECATQEEELNTEAEKLNQIEEFKKENETYTEKRAELKKHYRKESSRMWSNIGRIFFDFVDRTTTTYINANAQERNKNNSSNTQNNALIIKF